MTEPQDSLTLMRLYVDGELAEAERAAFERRLAGDPALRERVRFERALRERVARNMAGSAPPELRARVRQAMAAPAPPAVDRAASDRRRRTAPPRANVFAVAASLLLVTTAILFGIFGPQIDRWSARLPLGLVAEAALYASEEHGRCATDGAAREAKAAWTDPADVSGHFQTLLGVEVPVFDLSGVGYEFIGAGRCHVPGHVRSGHMLYGRPGDGDRPPAMVSLFLVPDVGQYDEDDLRRREGRWYEADGGPQCSHTVLRRGEGDLMIFLVCCHEQDLARVADTLAAALGEG